MFKFRYYFYLILSLLVWSSYSFILKNISINPVIFTFATTSIGWFFISGYIFKKKISVKVKRNNFWLLIIITFFFIVNSVTFFYAYQLTTISNAIFSHYLAPVFVSLLAPLILHEKIEKITIIALFLSICGMTLIFLSNGLHFYISKNDLLGIFLGVISAICYALLIIIVKHLINKKLDYFIVMFYQGFFTFLIFILILPFIKNSFSLNYKIILILILIGFTHSFLAPILYLEGLKYIKAQVAGLLGYIEIVGSIIIGIIFFKEIPNFLTFIGGVTIIIAGGMVILYGNNRLAKQ